MTLRAPMILLAVSLALAACGPSEQAGTAAVEAETTASAPAAFDLASVPISTADLGAAPYFSAPAGYRVEDSGVIRAAEFPVWTGGGFQIVEGDVHWQRFGAESGQSFSRLAVSRAVAERVAALGGVQVAAAEVPRAELETLPEVMRLELLSALGDQGNSPTVTYVIRRADRTIWVHSVVSVEVAYLSIVEASPPTA